LKNNIAENKGQNVEIGLITTPLSPPSQGGDEGEVFHIGYGRENRLIKMKIHIQSRYSPLKRVVGGLRKITHPLFPSF